MERRPLGRTGLEVSVLGFGAAPLGNEYGALDEAEVIHAVRHALDAEIDLFDVAPYYGRTLAEERLGRALEGVRDRVVLATKCCRFDRRGFDFSAARVHADLDASLARLRTDHVDLLQVHDVEFGSFEQIVEETLPACREVQAQGKARFIGITGLPLEMLRRLAEAVEVDTVLSYCHDNLLVRDLGRELGPLVDRGVGLLNASPLHMGILTDEGPPAWHPAPDEVKAAGRDLAALCRDHGTALPTVALRLAVERTRAASTLVGMSSVEEVDRNLAALDHPVEAGLREAIEARVAPVLDRTWHEGRPENAP